MADGGCASPGSSPVTHEVAITGFKFVPAELKVRPGDRIRWTNADFSAHTATADDGSWDTGGLDEGQSATIDVVAGMSLTYHCDFHRAMRAKLVECEA